MEDRITLQHKLKAVQSIYDLLDQQLEKAGFFERQEHLTWEVEKKRREVKSLKNRLAQLEGNGDEVANNLPHRCPGFVGRKKEIADSLQSLEEEDRGWGVIIEGTGGLGKTALSLEVAYEVHAKAAFEAYLFSSVNTTHFRPGGVPPETLALSSLDNLVYEIAELLGNNQILQITEGAERRKAILEHLKGRKILIVWDNLENLTEKERELAGEFLRKLPPPNKAITTSRRRSSESALRISLDRLNKEDAFELIAEVSQRYPDVAKEIEDMGENTKRNLYEISAGTPLVLHWTLGLVALKRFSLPEAISSLQEAARLLDPQSYLIDMVVQKLNDVESIVFSSLAVFQTSMSVDSLTKILELEAHSLETALNNLLTLTLVDEPKDKHYILRPFVRNYIEIVSDDLSQPLKPKKGGVTISAASCKKVLQYWVNFSKEYGGGKKNLHYFPHIEKEWFNLEKTCLVLRELSDPSGKTKDKESSRMLIDLSISLCRAAGPLFFRRYWDESIKLSKWAFEAARFLKDWRCAGWCAYDIAWVLYSRGETDGAANWVEIMSGNIEQSGNQRDKAVTKRLRGLVAFQKNNFPEAKNCFQEALNDYRELGREVDQSKALNDLGNIAKKQMDFEEAQTFYEEGLQLAQKSKDLESQAYITRNLGTLTFQMAHYKSSRQWYKDLLQLGEKVGQDDFVSTAQYGLVCILEKEKLHEEALEFAEKILPNLERKNSRELPKIRQIIWEIRGILNRQGNRN